MVWGCLVLLVLTMVITGVHSQPDSLGFISIDCGLRAHLSTVASETNLAYATDEHFIDTGRNYYIQSEYMSDKVEKEYMTLGSFPNGIRNCYTLRSLTIGSKYFVRAAFMYGNYDNLNKLPIFDIHLGPNWDTVRISTYEIYLTEIIVMTTSDYLQVCLINKNQGTPFISALELRPLETSIYKDANSTQSLVSYHRLNLGANDYLRYPQDPYDRFWDNFTLDTWTNISTSSTVSPDTEYATPSLVMQTAATTLNTKQSLDLPPWTSKNETVFLIILHIAEIQDIPRTSFREFDIFVNGEPAFNSIVPSKLHSGFTKYTHTGNTIYNVSLKATSNSTLPPLLNAFEIYAIKPTRVPTNSGDVTAINTIKANYEVKKIYWNGDPCVPTKLSWTGVTCTNDSTNIPRITALDLSYSGLTGAIISSFGNLSSLKSLDLSSNDLSGGLANFLEQLTALTYLDITGNSKISTTVPPGLQKNNKMEL